MIIDDFYYNKDTATTINNNDNEMDDTYKVS